MAENAISVFTAPLPSLCGEPDSGGGGGRRGRRKGEKKKKISPRRRKVSRNFMAQFVKRFSPRGGGRVAEGKRVSQKSAICEIQKREREKCVL